jgi:hypothetical protein
LFGESFSNHAYEVYAAAVKMQRGMLPDNVLLANNYEDSETSLIFMTKC